MFSTVAGMLAIIVLGILLSSSIKPREPIDCNINMSIRDISPKLRKPFNTGRPLGNKKFIDLLENISGRMWHRRKSGPKKRNNE